MLTPDLRADVHVVAMSLHLEHRASAVVAGAVVVVKNEGAVLRSAEVMRAIEVIIRGERQNRAVGEGVGPMKAAQIISLQIHIANAGGLLVLGIGNLVMILAQRSNPSELIVDGAVIQKGKEPARSAFLIVKDLRDRRSQPHIRTVAVHAGEIREPLRMPANIKLI